MEIKLFKHIYIQIKNFEDLETKFNDNPISQLFSEKGTMKNLLKKIEKLMDLQDVSFSPSKIRRDIENGSVLGQSISSMNSNNILHQTFTKL